MLTSSTLKRVISNPRKRRAAVIFIFGATCVVIITGFVFDREKPIEYGTMWLFEQCIGGFQHLFTNLDE